MHVSLRSLLLFVLVALLAVGTLAQRPSKKAMRNSLVRFGKRSQLGVSSEFGPDDRWAAFMGPYEGPAYVVPY